MQLRAMAMARCVLPAPVPPTSTALRCWAMKPLPARSRTSVSLIGVPSNWKSSRSLASGSLAVVSWYLIERACFSLISASRRSPTMRWGSCWRDVEDDIGGMDTVGDRFGACGLDRRQSVGEHRGEDVDHLPVAIVGASELAPY